MQQKEEVTNNQAEFQAILNTEKNELTLIFEFKQSQLPEANVLHNKDREPIHYIFCLDTSGSMAYKAIKDGNKTKMDLGIDLIDGYIKKHLTENDSFSLVTFTDIGKAQITNQSKANYLAQSPSPLEKLKANGGTFMESAINAIPAGGSYYKVHKPVLVYITDGDDSSRKSDVSKMIRESRKKTGCNALSFITWGIGKDYKPEKLYEMIKLSGSTQPYMVHVQSEVDIEGAHDILFNNIQFNNALDADITITIEGQAPQTIKNILLSADVQDARTFKLPKSPDGSEVTVGYRLQGNGISLNGSVNIAITKYEKTVGELNSLKYFISGFKPTGSAITDLATLVNEALKDSKIAEINNKGRIIPLALLDFDMARIVLNSVYELQEKAKAEALLLPEAGKVYIESMNCADKLLNILASNIFLYTGSAGGEQKTCKTSNQEFGNLGKAIMSHFTKGDRTAAAEQMMKKGLANTAYKVDPVTNQMIVTLDRRDYTLVGYGHNFAKSKANIMFADGSGADRRELLTVEYSDFITIASEFQKIQGFQDLFQAGLRLLHPVDASSHPYLIEKAKEENQLTREERLRLASNLKPKFLKFENGREIPVINLGNFIDQQVGVCRHHALFFAAFLGYMIQDGSNPFYAPGEVRIFRDTPYNPLKPHACTVYRQYAYEFVSSDEDDIQENQINFKITGDGITYTVISQGHVTTGQLTKEDLRDLNIELSFDEKEKETLAPQGLLEKLNAHAGDILRLTTARGHTYQPIYIFDSLLSRVYDLGKKEELQAAILEYNAKGMQGFLVNLLKKEKIDDNHPDLHEMPKFTDAEMERFGLDGDQYLHLHCPVGLQPMVNPVLLNLKNDAGDIIESPDLYEREMIEMWREQGGTRDPMTNQEIMGIVDEKDHPRIAAHQIALLEAIRKNCQFNEPENFATPSCTHQKLEESALRKQSRKEKWLEKAQERGVDLSAAFVEKSKAVAQSPMDAVKPTGDMSTVAALVPDIVVPGFSGEQGLVDGPKNKGKEKIVNPEDNLESEGRSLLSSATPPPVKQDIPNVTKTDPVDLMEPAIASQPVPSKSDNKSSVASLSSSSAGASHPLAQQSTVKPDPRGKGKEKELIDTKHLAFTPITILNENPPAPSSSRSPKPNLRTNRPSLENKAYEILTKHIRTLKAEIEKNRKDKNLSLKKDKIAELKELRENIGTNGWKESIKSARNTNETIRKCATLGRIGLFGIHISRSESALNDVLKAVESNKI